MNDDLYSRIKAVVGASIEDVYDTNLPDAPWLLTTPAIVAYEVSDTPTVAIDGRVTLRQKRLTLEVQSTDLGAARAIKEQLIPGLHAWRGTTTQVVEFESGGPVIFDAGLNPPRFCLPVDFMVTQ